MKKITLSIFLSFLLLCPVITWAEEIRLPLGLEWGISPETVLEILQTKGEPRYDKNKRIAGCLVGGKYPYLILCQFDKKGKLKYINKDEFILGYKDNFKAAITMAKALSNIFQKQGMSLESTKEELNNNIYTLSSLGLLVSIEPGTGSENHKSFFKEDIGVLHVLYLDPYFQKGPEGEPLTDAARIAEELRNLKK